MKKKIWMLLLLQCVLMIFSGCSIGDFFDLNSTMSSPRLSKAETEIENVVRGYLNEDFKFCRLFVDKRYSSCLRCNFNDKEYIIVFCHTGGSELKSHIILLESLSETWTVKDDIVQKNIKFNGVQILETNSEENCEMVLEGVDLETNLSVVFSWRIQNDGIIQIID